eukprot:scaffold7.g3684.t1
MAAVEWGSQVQFNSLAYAGDMTALAAIELGGQQLLLAGVGSSLRAYRLPQGDQLCCKVVLPCGIHIHGIRCLALERPGSGRPSPQAALAAVHGDRQAALWRLERSTDSAGEPAGAGWHLDLLCELPRFSHWTMDLSLSSLGSNSSSSGGSGGSGSAGKASAAAGQHLLMAVGLSDNSVETFLLSCDLPGGDLAAAGHVAGPPLPVLVQRAESRERCLLYSMHLHEQSAGSTSPAADCSNGCGSSCSHGSSRRLWVAAGTIFLDVVVWAAPPLRRPALATADGAVGPGLAACEAPTLLRLKGHEGSIHRVRWSPCGAMLASGSDDRTVRVWSTSALLGHPCSNGGSPCSSSPEQDGVGGPGPSGLRESELQPLHVLYGHTARLWDLCFLSTSVSAGPGAAAAACSGLLISASEDCTCRMWDLHTGAALATVQAHRGRGVWRCIPLSLESGQPFLVTGGADGGLKCWRLADWLPSSASAQVAAGAGAAQAAPAAATPARPLLVQSFALQGALPDPAAVGTGRSWTVLRHAHGAPGSSSSSSSAGHVEEIRPPHQQQDAAATPPPPAERRHDSKGEWVRCLALAGQRLLLVATNRGLLHRVLLPAPQQQRGVERWQTLYAAPAGSRSGPVIWLSCQVRASSGCGDSSSDTAASAAPRQQEELLVGMCTHAGSAVVVRQRRGASTSSCCWQPYGGRAAFAVFFCKTLETSCGTSSKGDDGCLCFTAGLDGLLTLCDSECLQPPVRLAEARSPCRDRLVALDAAPLGRAQPPSQQCEKDMAPAQLLVAAGDTSGNVIAWRLELATTGRGGWQQQQAQQASSMAVHACRLSLLVAARKVHEATPVRWVQAHVPGQGPVNLASCEVTSAGGDSSVCTLRLVEAPPRERVPCITTVEGASASGTQGHADEGCSSRPERVLWGFGAAHFVVWSATHDAEIARVPCGGWRRPSAVAVEGGDALCFSYIKDEEVCIYRRCSSSSLQGADRAAIGRSDASGLTACRSSAEAREGAATPAAGAPPRGLHPAQHGLEQTCALLLPLPLGTADDGVSSSSEPATGAELAAVLSGGEDGSLRLLLAQGAGSRGTVAGAQLLGQHAQGTPIKALALVALPAAGPTVAKARCAPQQRWLLVTAGAREVLMAWQLSCRCPRRSPELCCELLSVRSPPGNGRRSRPNKEGEHNRESDQRLLSVSCFLPPLGECQEPALLRPPEPAVTFVAAAASNASLDLMALHAPSLEAAAALAAAPQGGRARAAAWQPMAALRHHCSPVLCTAYCRLELEAAPGSGSTSHTRTLHLLLSGSTDGCVAVWDLTAICAAYLAAFRQQQQRQQLEPQQEHQQRGQQGSWALQELSPLLVLPDVHLSGVNALAAAPLALDAATGDSRGSNDGGRSGAASLLLVTGGDDQSLCFVRLDFSPCIGPPVGSSSNSTTEGSASCGCTCHVAWQAAVLNAHSSAVRGVWAGSSACLSVGLDQRVRCWQLDSAAAAAEAAEQRGAAAAPAVHEAGCIVTQVLEPAALDVLPPRGPARGEASSSGAYRVAVVGRGSEVLSCGPL